MNGNETEKRVLSDIFLQHLPHDLNGYMTKGQIVSFQIPRTNHILNMSNSYLEVQMVINISINAAVADSTDWVGLINAATIFNTVSIISGGKTIYNDTFSQVNSRYWQMSKSEDYNRANYASFLNTEDITLNGGFLTYPVRKLAVAPTDPIKFNMRIPLPSLIQCFENVNEFPACGLNENFIMEFTLADPSSYFIYADSENNKVSRVRSISEVPAITLDLSEDSYKITDLRMITPAFIADSFERAEVEKLSNGIGISHGFYNYSVQAQQLNYSTQRSNSLTFSSQSENIKAVAIASSRNNSYCVFDKPFMKDIEINLSEGNSLIRNRVHTGDNYSDGTDLYYNILTGFGQNSYTYLSRLNDAVINDNLSKDPARLLGSYFQWYKAAVGEEIGPSADSFYNSIIYKNSTQVVPPYAHYAISNPDEVSLVFLSTLSFRYLRFKNGAVEIITPFPEEVDVREAIKNNPKIRHGIAGPLIGGGVSLITSLIGSLRDAVRKRRADHNLINAYTVLGKDAFEYHQDRLKEHAGINKGKFSKFVNSLKALQVPLDENIDHGIGDEEIQLSNVFKTIPKESYTNKFLNKDYNRPLSIGSRSGLAGGKFKLRPYGDDYAGIGISHGFRDWIKRQWGKFTNWIKPKIPAVISNIASTAKKYANDLLTGKIRIKDIPGKLKDEVLNIVKSIKEGKSITEPVDPGPEGPVDRIVEIVNKIKTGRMNLNQVPKELINQVRMILFENQNNSHGLLVRHGVLIRHGEESMPAWEKGIKFPTNRKNNRRGLMKTRVDKIYKKLDSGAPPSIKHLKKIYAMNYVKSNPRVFKMA